ncbi:hypothetical protein PHLCEN_2v9586 [Hermanssonia centrifuga]|uniref:Secreted protein n=1 Tax=Hermanssonia centrifuga TaxID=98765 RepID=A0A2R6NQ84_9APHY|nr:hypothetical protein PHLCEN_2v9586 [Hermanssonia centrifuga]
MFQASTSLFFHLSSSLFLAFLVARLVVVDRLDSLGLSSVFVHHLKLPDRFVHSPSHPTRHTLGPDLAHGVYASSRLARQYRRQVVERVPTPVSA